MVRVTTAAQAAAMDARAIAAGTPSWSLMEAAGRAAAGVIRERLAAFLEGGVVVLAGGGNNGGDGYVVASELAAGGIGVSVVATAEPATDDARKARAGLPAGVGVQTWNDLAPGRAEGTLIVDALLGTGASGAPRGAVADAIAMIARARAAGVPVVALDIPSGVDATTGAAPGAFVRADLTITFGTIKRGLLRNRGAAGAIVAVDIGLGAASDDDAAPTLVDAGRALDAVPPIGAGANKGTRRKLLVFGGAAGMAGATILAARGALRSGVGMVKACVEPPSVVPVQAAEPAALTAPWPVDDSALHVYLEWAHGVLLGPGLGLGRASRELAERVLAAWRGPVVVDADALTVFEGRPERLAELLAGRPAVITPHAVEAQRLAGVNAADLDAGRFDAAARLADRVKATVLLKGVPTVVSDGRRSLVVATGTPVLATGGSGDILGGVVATLLAQTGDPLASAASAAWVHGRAAEIAGAGDVRGVTLDDVLDAMRGAWRRTPDPRPPVLAELPRTGDRA
jgi:NAD(P)H-hydrate epimerase